VFIKLSLPKDCLKGIFQKKNYFVKAFLDFEKGYSKPKFYLHYANKKKPLAISYGFYRELFLFMKTCLFLLCMIVFELLKLYQVGLDRFVSNLKSV
jgi:hypothetical protein